MTTRARARQWRCTTLMEMEGEVVRAKARERASVGMASNKASAESFGARGSGKRRGSGRPRYEWTRGDSNTEEGKDGQDSAAANEMPAWPAQESGRELQGREHLRALANQGSVQRLGERRFHLRVQATVEPISAYYMMFTTAGPTTRLCACREKRMHCVCYGTLQAAASSDRGKEARRE